MSELLAQAQHWLLALVLSVPRVLALFAVLPFLTRQVLPPTLRNGVAIVLALVAVPGVHAALPGHALDFPAVLLLIGKELLLGGLAGYLVALLFWAVAAAGFFLDSQRGAMSATLFTPLVGSETSPLGAFLTQVLVTLLFVSGGFLALLDALYTSYLSWPVLSWWPRLDLQGALFFLQQLDGLMRVMLLIAGPAVILMLLAELGMALIGRFVPQINVFLLAMPVKSALALLFLALYMGAIVRWADGAFADVGGLVRRLGQFLP